MQTTLVGYPRLGAQRELKKVTEQYFRKEISGERLLAETAKQRDAQWLLQKQKGLDILPVNDFSLYDGMLDTAALLNVLPARYQKLGLDALAVYFAQARGYQDGGQDVKALKMRKWFNTNYHYLVPEIEDGTRLEIQNSHKVFAECQAAEKLGLNYRPVLIGPYTFLRLSNNRSARSSAALAAELARAYGEILARLTAYSCAYVQLDEPALVLDLDAEEIALFEQIYTALLAQKQGQKILLQTYFGDIRDVYTRVMSLNFDAVGLDLLEGRHNLELIAKHGFPADKTLYAGLVNGKNIWRNNYQQSLAALRALPLPAEQIVLSTSCSLLHVPYALRYEQKMPEKYKKQLAFAEEKLDELQELKTLQSGGGEELLKRNQEILAAKQNDPDFYNQRVREEVSRILAADFVRQPPFAERKILQQRILNLPALPTTTIGSFPQTGEVRELRRSYKQGRIDAAEYNAGLRAKIKAVIALQEELGLDVLVHGEYERNDMVEYFGEHLRGFLFTENGWVQSYGTRGVKPPVIFGDVSWPEAFTVEWITYAQSLTSKPVKGMLTGPVTILNWSFPREDISLQEIAYQIALAIQAEVLALEKQQIKVIQIDEAALREKLPLRKRYWHTDYLDWAVKAFRLAHYPVRPETQIHTHMCYSEFEDILAEIKALEADVLTVEAARSDLSLLDALQQAGYAGDIGPGVYDIHSPRVPDTAELTGIIEKLCAKLDSAQIWVNPDCGLKTRGESETSASLRNMVAAAKQVRAKHSLVEANRS